MARLVDPYPAQFHARKQLTGLPTPSRWQRPFAESRRSVASWDGQRSLKDVERPCESKESIGESRPVACLMLETILINQMDVLPSCLATDMDRGS